LEGGTAAAQAGVAEQEAVALALGHTAEARGASAAEAAMAAAALVEGVPVAATAVVAQLAACAGIRLAVQVAAVGVLVMAKAEELAVWAVGKVAGKPYRSTANTGRIHTVSSMHSGRLLASGTRTSMPSGSSP
jgi:hypothetical protein